MIQPDIWGAVVPAWLSAVGGVAAATVGTVAFVKSLKTQGGVETLKRAANEAADRAEPVTEAQPDDSSAPTPSKRVSWTTWHESKSKYRLRNDSIHTGVSAELVSFRDVTPDPGGNDAHTAAILPVMLAPGESIPFTIEKSLASPSVTAIEILYRREGRGLPIKTTLYV